jgi:glycosyltransferase involved in cell wall biosynthesis
MKRRVVILTGIFPPDIGGPATSVPELARSLRGEGYGVAVVTLSESDLGGADPCPVIRVPRQLSRGRRTTAVWRAALSARPSVVFANGLHLESALLPHVPVIQKLVGDWAWERARNAGATNLSLEDFQSADLSPKVRALCALRSAVTRRARLVVVPSRHLAGVVQNWGISRSRVRVIPNAAPPVVDETPRLRADGRALFVGRLVAWKHVDHILQVLTRFPSLGLDVIGTGPEYESLQRMARSMGVEHRVQFLGALPRPQVLEHMDNAAFLVLASSHEGMPHVVLEAFARGLPVVASNGGGTPEIVVDGNSGVLYPAGDVDALAAAIRQIGRPDIAMEVVRGGFETARRLSLARMTKATIEVVQEVTG